MPIFEYRCEACGASFELLIRGGDVPTCASCGATTLTREISLFAVSSDEINYRNRQTLGARQRQQSQAAQKEREHYKSDHHDD
jgi:putative FmdB family regulatory protein